LPAWGVLGSAISGFTVSPYSPCCFQEYGDYSNPPKPLLVQVLQNFTFGAIAQIFLNMINARTHFSRVQAGFRVDCGNMRQQKARRF
jgi:hypothetical protein